MKKKQFIHIYIYYITYLYFNSDNIKFGELRGEIYRYMYPTHI